MGKLFKMMISGVLGIHRVVAQINKKCVVLEETQFQDRLAKKYVGMEYSIKVNIGTI